MIPVAFFLVKDKPSDVGQLPDGSATVDDMAHQRKTFKVFKNEHSLPFAKAVRTPAFWLISLAATGGFAAYSFASSQGVIHFTTIGLDRASSWPAFPSWAAPGWWARWSWDRFPTA